MDETSGRAAWNGLHERLPDGFSLTRLKGNHMHTAVCMVFTHRLGWELRLAIEGHGWETTAVIGSADDMRMTVEQWRASLLEKGWN